MNTRVSYLYRDADNYKMHNECVVSGEVTPDMQQRILDSLSDGEYFIPRQVGLPEVRFDDGWTDADHCWFELSDDGFEATTDAPTTNISAAELTDAFRACRGRWNDTVWGPPVGIEKPARFTGMIPNELRDFLKDIQQKGPYNWPNLYFAWEKPDGSLFIVGVKSSQMYHVIVHEQNPKSWDNNIRADRGEPLEYSSVLYGISPNTTYIENNQRFDPIERLTSKVAEFSYLGAWEDPDVVMYDPYANTNVIACGRWELAVSHICPDRLPALQGGRGVVVDEVLADARAREVDVVRKDAPEKSLD